MLDFLSSIASGITANGITRVIEAFWGGNKAYNIQASEPEKPIEKALSEEETSTPLFKNFHIKSGFEPVFNSILEPVVHFIIEDKPTTAWHLVTIVVECKQTGQWYVSRKGEMAFEGSGGGLYVANRIIETCKDRKIPNSAWVLPQAKTNALSQGFLHWHEVNKELVPLLSYSGSEYFIDYIANKYSEVNSQND